jgi:hypothetical protein
MWWNRIKGYLEGGSGKKKSGNLCSMFQRTLCSMFQCLDHVSISMFQTCISYVVYQFLCSMYLFCCVDDHSVYGALPMFSSHLF